MIDPESQIDPERVLAHLGEPSYRPAKLKELARELGVSGDEYRPLRQLMHLLEAGGKVTRVHKGRYVLPKALTRTWGRLRLHERGFGFVGRAGTEADVFIGAGFLLDATDGEWVEVEVTEAGDGGERLPRGRVVAVRRQPARERCGIFQRRGRHGLVVTDDARIFLDTPPPDGIAKGDLVVVEAEEADGRSARSQAGRIVRILGDPADPRHDFETVTLAHGIRVIDDPEAAGEAAARTADASQEREQELTRRRDLRELTVVTIDPDEARDFDDAVSVEALASGETRLGVHIADVAHYVPLGGAVDTQARERATSTYLLDRVVHMLPPSLAADLCTLTPHEDRLAVSVFLDIDGGGTVQHRSFCLSVIRSADRLTYSQVQAALDDDHRGAGPAASHTALLETMSDLSQRLRARRLDRGAIDFDLSEAAVTMGDEGIPVWLGKAEHLSSHRLVEEFMLAANEAVAEEAAEAQLGVLFRIHDPPDPGKLEAFRGLAGALGYRLPGPQGITSGDLQKALDALHGRPDAALLSQLLLRAMMRACYATEEGEGHFGLASERYLHFTSPIRRYPDLVVHRALRSHLTGDSMSPEADLGWLAQWTSHCERRSEAAEREYLRLKQLRFMVGKEGDEFDGIVSGVVGAGVFVEIGDWLVEGFCAMRLLDDYFEFDESHHRQRGQQTGVVFAMGTSVRVRVLTVEPQLRRLDLLIIAGGSDGGRTGHSSGGRGARRASARDRRQAQRQARPKGKGGRGRRGGSRRR
ncbi:MAG: VacB/RNase II family 3'-5' exoribonuclease [Candidatus Latescibacteria bacterium]|nr:VacB/RNase II family 3'-5' exoribonuclease [Candidatus Latescibacterota bacterium]